MAARGTAVVPTLVNVENFPGFAAAGEAKFPAYASTMRRLYAQSGAVVRAACEAGVPVFAGTDAGGGIEHGVIADEIRALHDGRAAGRGGAGRRLVGGPGVARAAVHRGGRAGRPGGLRRRPAGRPGDVTATATDWCCAGASSADYSLRASSPGRSAGGAAAGSSRPRAGRRPARRAP